MGKKSGRKDAAPIQAAEASTKAPAGGRSSAKGSKISDELRQAVKDLGGDDDDLELIEGIDDDEDEAPVKSGKGKVKEPSMDEKSLKKALGEFMKGMDFGTTAQVVAASESEEETSEEDSGDEDDNEEADDDDESEEEEEDSDEEESSDEDIAEIAPAPSITKTAPPVASVQKAAAVKPTLAVLDPKQTSGTDVPAAPSWTSLLPPLAPSSQPLEPIPPFKLAGLRNRANQFLENLPALSRAGSSSDAAFINQILANGTHQDKLSALILIVRESPIHAVKELKRLRTMIGWKEDGTMGGGGNKDQRIAVMKALADWWVSGGGKESGKLKYFADQPLLAHPDVTDRHLLVFAFEDFLKRWFFNLLQGLEVFSHDILPFIKTQTLHMVFRLLQGNAEQEQNLLRLGVNKLGDNDRSVASKTSHHILQLLQAHPAMKAVVAREISALVLKPATATAAAESAGHMRFDDEPKKTVGALAKTPATTHGRYYGLITLNQITLTANDREVAGRMVELYFEVFREILGEGKDDVDEDAEAARAREVEKVAGKVEKWRGRRKGAKPRGGRKTALEEEVVDNHDTRLVAAVLTGINRALPFAKLDEDIFSKYMDTLFKITHAGTFNTSIQSLQLISQVSKSRPTVADRFFRTLYDSLFDPRLVTSSKQAMYLNLLFKSLKNDDNIARVMAFVKRLLQMLSLQQPPFICGALYLLGELFASTPGLKRMLIEPEDDGEEHFVDAPEEGQAPVAESSTSAALGKTYDGRKRAPQFAQADTSCLWELTPFLSHFHPSVSLQAHQLLMSQPLTGSSDISLNSLVSFLDRFVYRNPKKTLQPKGASIMQPAAVYDKSGSVVANKGARSGDDGFVNSEKFWRKKIEDVPVDQMFFHKFFAGKLAQKEAASRKKKGKAESDDEDEEDEGDVEDAEVASEEPESDAASSDAAPEEEEEEDSDAEEAEIWKAMQATMPDAEDVEISSDDFDSDEISDSDEEDEDENQGVEVDQEDEEEDEDEEEEDEDEDDEDVPPPPSIKSKGKGKQPSVSSDDEDDEQLSDGSAAFDFADEDADMLSDDDMPDIVLGGDDDAEESEEEAAKGKRKRTDDRKERRKKRREMPTFGSYEDYAAMIEAAGNDGED